MAAHRVLITSFALRRDDQAVSRLGFGVSGNLWRIRVEVKWTEDTSTASHTLPFEVIRTAQEAL